ncbi:MAG: ribosome maturation factor RimP [Mycobacterium sp.]
MTDRPAGSPGGLPSPEQVTRLLAAEFALAGYEIENVTVDSRTQPPRIVVVADGDTPPDLEAVAELSRSASERLDALETGAATYVLEVTSPGVDRPLTEEKHFRRARGRKVEFELVDAETVSGRLGVIVDGVADLIVRERSRLTVRKVALSDIRKAVVQVEFSAPSAQELELAGGPSPTTRTEAHG